MNSEELAARFREAVTNGEWFEIIYHAGSRPGAQRRIAPIAVFDDRIRARCYTSNSVKPFMLDKIQIIQAGSGSDAPVWSTAPLPPVVPLVEDTRCVHRIYGEALQAQGWRVEIETLEGGWHLHLTGHFKNGKPRKTPTHSLYFDHSSRDSWLDPHGAVVFGEIRPRVRKWGFQSKTYSQYEVPVAAFLTAAGVATDQLSP